MLGEAEKQFKKTQIKGGEMKATTSVMKNTLEGINSVDTTRGKMSELEDNRNNPNKTQRVFKILTEHP